MPKPLLHEHTQFKQLIEIVADERKIQPALVEKDYWIMHALWGLQKQGLQLELKGGTSLSKGYGVIHRFSEDLDIKIEPEATDKVFRGKNHLDPKHVESRRTYFEKLTTKIRIPGMEAKRDPEFDDRERMRSAGIRLHYLSLYEPVAGLKGGVLLEVGFDTTQPSEKLLISSWAWDRAQQPGVEVEDNRVVQVSCYHPGYTFVEKLQAVMRKYEQYQAGKALPNNFLRHYYDLYQLLENGRVQSFIGTDDYKAHKKERFKSLDLDVSKSEAFRLDDREVFGEFERQYRATAVLYFNGQPELRAILNRIGKELHRL